MASSEQIEDGYGEICDVLVPLRDQGEEACRLAQGVQLGPERFRLLGPAPLGEEWLFQPGEIVRCRIKVLTLREAHWIAMERVSAESGATAKGTQRGK